MCVWFIIFNLQKKEHVLCNHAKQITLEDTFHVTVCFKYTHSYGLCWHRWHYTIYSKPAGRETNVFKRVTEDICTKKSDKAHFLPRLINLAECIVAGCIPKFILNVYLYIALARIWHCWYLCPISLSISISQRENMCCDETWIMLYS